MENPSPSPDPLARLLDRWSGTPEPSPAIRQEVRRRIALGPGRALAPEPWFVELFSRPAFAALFVFCCIVTGLFFAEVRVARQQAETSSRLARSYVELINPLLRDPVKEAGPP